MRSKGRFTAPEPLAGAAVKLWLLGCSAAIWMGSTSREHSLVRQYGFASSLPRPTLATPTLGIQTGVSTEAVKSVRQVRDLVERLLGATDVARFLVAEQEVAEATD